MKFLRIIARNLLIALSLYSSLTSAVGPAQTAAFLPLYPEGYDSPKNTSYDTFRQRMRLQPYTDNDNTISVLFYNDDKHSGYGTATISFGNSVKLTTLAPNADFIKDSTNDGSYYKALAFTASRLRNEKSQEELLCLTMKTSYGIRPVTCRLFVPASISEPIPQSVEDVYDVDRTCSSISPACYRTQSSLSNNDNANFGIRFSGQAVQCIQESLYNLFFAPAKCAQDSNPYIYSFPLFSWGLSSVISALLIIYTIHFAFSMIAPAKENELQVSKIFIFVFKMLLVVYFTLGIRIPFFDDAQTIRVNNGITNLALPLFTDAVNSLTLMILNSAPVQDGMCNFSPSSYQQGYEHYALWDSLDCRISYFFTPKFWGSISTLINSYISGLSTITKIIIVLIAIWLMIALVVVILVFSDGIQSLILILAGLVFLFVSSLAAVFSLTIAILMQMSQFLSIALRFIVHYIKCIFYLYVMLYISPIFVPLCLFESTKKYFNRWLNNMISYALQPMVFMSLIVFLFRITDSLLYGTCKVTYDSNGDLVISNGDESSCKNSTGYQIYNIAKSGSGSLSDTIASMEAILYPMFVMYLFNKFMAKASGIAASLTQGVDLTVAEKPAPPPPPPAKPK